MFAIVDIETTGGYANGNGITEVAIAIHDGVCMIDYFETLVNPGIPIPRYVQSLTGISNAMISQAPQFEEVAPRIYEMLHDKIFVAHNVNFDYSFIKHNLEQHGLHIECKKLCTVRLGRKIFPGHPSYSLGNLCRTLNISVENRHRAGGDVRATVKLFERLLQNDEKGILKDMLKGRSSHGILPPNLPEEKVSTLPHSPGVYYFHNQKGKIIYVGKAKDLKKRVSSHFTNNKPGKQKQDFLRETFDITYTVCGSELMAYILESVEIKRIWPLYNRSQKGFQQTYGMYSYEDGRGFMRLLIEKEKKNLKPLYTFSLLMDGYNMVKALIKEFDLCPRLCFIDHSPGQSMPEQSGISCTEYNKRVQRAISHLETALPSFAVVERVVQTPDSPQKGIILVEKGRFYGMGYLPANATVAALDDVKQQVTPYPENEYIRSLIYSYAARFPETRFEFAC